MSKVSAILTDSSKLFQTFWMAKEKSRSLNLVLVSGMMHLGPETERRHCRAGSRLLLKDAMDSLTYKGQWLLWTMNIRGTPCTEYREWLVTSAASLVLGGHGHAVKGQVQPKQWHSARAIKGSKSIGAGHTEQHHSSRVNKKWRLRPADYKNNIQIVLLGSPILCSV